MPGRVGVGPSTATGLAAEFRLSAVQVLAWMRRDDVLLEPAMRAVLPTSSIRGAAESEGR